jgi:adenine-specific DNA-methyltransferase
LTSTPTAAYARLIELLQELFEFDKAELDFGIYRIMSQKREDVSRFLEHDLLPDVRAALADYAGAERADIEVQLGQLKTQLLEAGVELDASAKYRELQGALAEIDRRAGLEDEVYSDLYRFFRRYYKDGDFLTLRRYKEGVYAIPYEGEEVKFHWANFDQYYVKSSEAFQNYRFRLVDRRHVHFRLTAVTAERDNNKPAEGERRFVLREEHPFEEVGGELNVYFQYRERDDKQTDLNARALATLLEAPELSGWREALSATAPTATNANRTVLEKRLTDYTARNTFDYFIHKDLAGFLRRELDFFLKNEVLHVDDLDVDGDAHLGPAVAKLRATKRIGRKIIEFLAQLEDFQKLLWLKKKFVLETGYCITLDRVPEALYAEIAANDAQREEWVRLFAIDEIEASMVTPSYSEPLTVEFLKANPHLVLDTKFFDASFKQSLVGAFDDLESALDGLLVKSENFQALNLLKRRLEGQVECVYIDPPYNTGDSEIPYKNAYLRSSWLTLMENRLTAGRPLHAPDPVLYIAIDDFEMANLAKLVDTQFPSMRREVIVVNHHPQGGKAKTLAHTHEYMLACVDRGSDRTLVGRESQDGVELRPFKRSGTAESNFRKRPNGKGRPNSFYAILVDPEAKRVVGLEPPPARDDDDYPTNPTNEGYVRVYPIGSDRSERVWRRSYESGLALAEADKLHCSNNLTIYQRIETHERSAALFSNWVDPRYNAGTFGANLLRDIIGEQNPFSYPKSVHTVEDAIFSVGLEDDAWVLDYFAGSGTTGHAVINLNREEGTRRKYILVEMGEYFESVLKPRIEKVVYSKDWKGGKPISREGSSHMLKYIRLESYEDTLDNLDLRRPAQVQALLDESPGAREDYMLHYALEIETRDSASLLDVRRFEHPFSYELRITEGGESRAVTVDLVETFNWLLGLSVEKVRVVDGFHTIEGTDPQGKRVLVIWRQLAEPSSDDEALRRYFTEQGYGRRGEDTLDRVYVNGDCTLAALRGEGDRWEVLLTEEEFKRLMFEAQTSGSL